MYVLLCCCTKVIRGYLPLPSVKKEIYMKTHISKLEIKSSFDCQATPKTGTPR